MKTKIKCPNEKKDAVMQQLADILPKSMENVRDVLTVDGLGIFMQDAWVLVRPSGTEPVIRITCEGSQESVVESILQTVKEVVEKIIEGHT